LFERPRTNQHKYDALSLRGLNRSSCRLKTPPGTWQARRRHCRAIDNTSPARAEVTIEGGDGWRNRNDFAIAWTNMPERDRAPITAVTYRLCAAGTADCARGRAGGADISRLELDAPAPGAVHCFHLASRRRRQRERRRCIGARDRCASILSHRS
jgi:hypothetical protein